MAYIILNKNNFFNNLDLIAKQTKDKDKIALVLKDNAYGHGIFEMAKLAQEYGITKAVVRSNEEAKRVEDFFEYVLVLSDIPTLYSEKKSYTINDIHTIKKFIKNTKVELKVNTGMNRNGIEMSELEDAFKEIKTQGLRLEAVFTHHGCADELNGLYQLQKDNFQKVKLTAKKLAQKYGFSKLRFHSCNSAALFREDNFDEDMVRVGIAAYGCMQLPLEINQTKFKPILSLYASKISSRVLKSGSFVGYGATFSSQSDCVVSNYDFGYGDGFLRSCSNIYETPQMVKIAGKISMDNSSFVSDEDKLLIFNDASEVSNFANTISYEVLTSLKPTIKREIV